MAKVGCSLGITMHVGLPANNEYVRMTVEISDIDAEAPLGPQLGKAELAIRETFGTAEAYLEGKIKEELDRKIS